MERVSKTDTLKTLVLSDLKRAQRLITRIHPDPIDPQFRIASPDGDWWIGITLTEDPQEREKRMALVADFMALKLSPGFVLATELHQPDAVLSIGIVANDYAGAMSLIDRKGTGAVAPTFSEPAWIEREHMDPLIFSFRPNRSSTLSTSRMQELTQWFGPRGKFPAIKIDPR